MDQSELLAEAIARAWPDDSSAAPSDVSRLEPDLVPALRKLASSPDAEAGPVRAEVLSLIQPFPWLAERVNNEIEQLGLIAEQEAAGSAVDVAGGVKHYPHSLVEIAYVTDRRPTGKSNVGQWYGSDRGELSCGVAQVSMPDDHQMGQLEKPRPWRLQFRSDLRYRLAVASLAPSGLQDYGSMLAGLLDRAPEPDVLVFMHGYNVSFADAARRAAQIAYDLDFKGVPLLYSWPSEAVPSSYFVDGENAQWSRQNFSAFLQLMLSSPDCRQVHVIAHSMGNRILVEALSGLAVAAPPAGTARLGQVVFAAPDVDAGVFVHAAQKFADLAAGYTLYVSERDQALNLSRTFVKYPRAGQAGDGIVVVDGVDTIDVSELDTGLMSHSYIGNHRSVVSDLYYLIQRGDQPDQRFGLRPVAAPNGIYWAFKR